jgi:hypothetical protein
MYLNIQHGTVCKALTANRQQHLGIAAKLVDQEQQSKERKHCASAHQP